MANNYTILNSLGISVTFRSTDDGSGLQIANNRLTDATGSNFFPTADAAARRLYAQITDGTNSFPTADVAARKLFAALTDGTNTATIKAASTAALVTDTALVVRPLLPTDGTNTTPAGDAIARAIFQELTDGTTGPVFVTPASTAALAANKALVVALHPTSPVTTNAEATLTAGAAPSKALVLAGQFLSNATLPAATTGQTVALQTDPAGTQKVGLVPLGTPVYAGSGSVAAASAVATLTIPAAKMGYLDGFDVDGLGATAGSAIVLTIAGLLGGTLTYAFGVPAGATVPVHQSFRFNTPLQASAVATNLVVTAASFGAGNTAASITAYGHYL